MTRTPDHDSFYAADLSRAIAGVVLTVPSQQWPRSWDSCRRSAATQYWTFRRTVRIGIYLSLSESELNDASRIDCLSGIDGGSPWMRLDYAGMEGIKKPAITRVFGRLWMLLDA
jgi:hypothetical protein